MARRLDEEQAAVNTGILDVTLTLSSEFLAEVGRVLILDVLDDRVPAETQLAECGYIAREAQIHHRSLFTWSP